MESINLYAECPKHGNIFEFKGKILKKEAIAECEKCAFFPDFSPESTKKECHINCADGSFTQCNIDFYIVNGWVVCDKHGKIIERVTETVYMTVFELDTFRESLRAKSDNFSISHVFIPKK